MLDFAGRVARALDTGLRATVYGSATSYGADDFCDYGPGRRTEGNEANDLAVVLARAESLGWNVVRTEFYVRLTPPNSDAGSEYAASWSSRRGEGKESRARV